MNYKHFKCLIQSTFVEKYDFQMNAYISAKMVKQEWYTQKDPMCILKKALVS